MKITNRLLIIIWFGTLAILATLYFTFKFNTQRKADVELSKKIHFAFDCYRMTADLRVTDVYCTNLDKYKEDVKKGFIAPVD